MKSNRYTIFFLIILGFYSIFSFFVMRDFGATWDETPRHISGQVTADYIEGKINNFNSLEGDSIYYGPFFETLNHYFGNALEKPFHMGEMDAFHVLIILISILGILFFFKLVSEMFSGKTALLSSTLLMTYPVFFAHSHYNSKDIPLFSLFIVTLYFLYTGFKHEKIWTIIIGGIFCGLLLDTRIDGFLLLPVFFGAYILFIVFGLKKSWEEWISHVKKDILFTFVFVAVASVTVYIAWPALWHNPLLFFRALNYFLHHSWGENVLYFGKLYPERHIPWHYAPFFLVATTPLAVLILAIIGLAIATKRILRGEKFFEITLVFLWLFLRLGLAILPESVKYDGIRQFLIIVPAFIIFAAIGFDFILEKIPNYFLKIKKWKIQAGIIFVIFFWIIFEFFKIFPFGGSYFNETVRFIFPKNLDKKFDFEYWGPSYRQGISWLNENAELNSMFCVPIAEHLIKFYSVRPDLKFDCGENTNYLMFFTRWAFITDDLENNYHYKEKDPIFRISRYDSDLLLIYGAK